MSSILKNGTRCVIVAGCPENIGLIVVTTEHLGAYDGREDAYRIVTLSGRPFAQLIRGKRTVKGYSNEAITDRYKLRPLVDPRIPSGEEIAQQWVDELNRLETLHVQ